MFGSGHLDFEADRDDSAQGQPSLSYMAQSAINRLSKDDKGFFLLVEAARIDHAHHDTNAKRSLTETLMLDRTVQVLITFSIIIIRNVLCFINFLGNN